MALTDPVKLFEQAPVAVTPLGAGGVLVDFGRVAFGNLCLRPCDGATGTVTLHFGEAFAHGRINRNPPGSVRYARVDVDLAGGQTVVVAPPADERNTGHPAAVKTPNDWGVVLPFRWVEVEAWPGEFQPACITRRAAFASSWDDEAASFASSEPLLDRIWELCRYSIKATTFAGVYVDGDRERIAYEADAYLNQLSHYACDLGVQMARDTFDRLLAFPTWPSEWALHMIFMAYADWMQTGDRVWLAARYERLQPKLLLERARADGLLVSTSAHREKGDLVDWPEGERDGFVFTSVNTVLNAFHVRALMQMSELASALGKDEDAWAYANRASAAGQALRDKLFDPARGLYRDGEGTDHTSLHANLFPLAFGLVPRAARPSVAAWLAARGMACSVYAAQYLLEGLFQHGFAREALALMIAPGDRSWRHMVESGTTITWEAWDQAYKPNQDWTHAWGAAPANLLPRFVLGAQPLTPGWTHLRLCPQPGHLTWAEGKIPTPRGPVAVRWESGPPFRLNVTLPPGLPARVEVPALAGSLGVWVDGRRIAARCVGGQWVFEHDQAGAACIEVR